MAAEEFAKWLDNAERIVDAKFAVLIVLILAVGYLITIRHRAEQKLESRNNEVLAIAKESTAAMVQNTAIIQNLIQAINGGKK